MTCLSLIADHHRLLGHPIAGASFEGLVLEQIVSLLPLGVRPSFHRTHAGGEVSVGRFARVADWRAGRYIMKRPGELALAGARP